MKPGIFVALTVASAALISGCSLNLTVSDGFTFDYRGDQATRTVSGPLPEGIEQIVIENRFGTVQVQASELGDEGWSWQLTTWSDSLEEAESFAQKIDMSLQQDSHTGSWKLMLPKPPQRRLRGVKSDLKLIVPATLAVQIKNRGDVVVRELAGNATIDNRHGDVALRNLTGQCTVSNEHGEIAAANLRTAEIANRHGPLTAEGVSGDLNVRNQHGSITVTGVSGGLVARNSHGKIEVNRVAGDVDVHCQHNHISVSEVGGDAQLRNQHGRIRGQELEGSIDVESNHGKVDLRVNATSVHYKGSHSSMELFVANSTVETVSAETSHGSIDVTFPTDLPLPIAAKAKYGKVRSEFPLVASDESQLVFETRHGNVRIRRASATSAGVQ